MNDNVDACCLMCGVVFVTSEKAIQEIDAECPKCGSNAVSRKEDDHGPEGDNSGVA